MPPSFLLNDLREEVPEKCVGTPDYLAPECVLGMSQDAMVDWVRVLYFYMLQCKLLSLVMSLRLANIFRSFIIVGIGRDLLRVFVWMSTFPRRDA